MASPLAGKGVLVTRAKGQNISLIELLQAEGAVPLEFPTIAIVAAPNPQPLREAINNLAAYQWLVFTSVNGVSHFWKALQAVGKDASALNKLKVAAVGQATANELTRRGASVALMPNIHTAEALLEAMNSVAGQKILIPGADIARPNLAQGLRVKGATVHQITAYQTRPQTERGNLSQLLPQTDVITFTSSSTVQNFISLLQAEELETVITQKIIASIGPVTTETAQSLGLPVHISAKKHTISGLVAALRYYFE